jgi:hypothetical protein
MPSPGSRTTAENNGDAGDSDDADSVSSTASCTR